MLLEAVGQDHQCLVSATHLGAFEHGWRRASQLVEMRAGAIAAA
jgi:DNA replication and repair protein RecF